jgi:hypothetical protein
LQGVVQCDLEDVFDAAGGNQFLGGTQGVWWFKGGLAAFTKEHNQYYRLEMSADDGQSSHCMGEKVK